MASTVEVGYSDSSAVRQQWITYLVSLTKKNASIAKLTTRPKVYEWQRRPLQVLEAMTDSMILFSAFVWR
jgi:hypothetical protein